MLQCTGKIEFVPNKTYARNQCFFKSSSQVKLYISCRKYLIHKTMIKAFLVCILRSSSTVDCVGEWILHYLISSKFRNQRDNFYAPFLVLREKIGRSRRLFFVSSFEPDSKALNIYHRHCSSCACVVFLMCGAQTLVVS